MVTHHSIIGAHLSVAHGFFQALIDAPSIGLSAVQIFTHSNRQWHIPKLAKDDIEHFKKTQKETGIICVVHASYLLNLGSPTKELRDKSLSALMAELQHCHELNIPFLVIHPGSATDGDKQSSIKHLAEALSYALKHSQGSTKILIETMAGQGTSLGSTLEELATIRELITEKRRVGFCMDTCHLFAAGYSLSSEQDYKDFWHHADKILGLNHIEVLHVNDSQKKQGSRVDRHENIGKGEIGLSTFAHIMNDHRFISVPKILETPNTTLDEYKKNKDTLEGLIAKK